jgi:hypothetical protein
MSEVQKKQTNLREKLAELLDFRKMRDRLSGLGLYIGKDRTNTDENLLVRGGANVDDLQLAEISAAVGGTAVDVFVYDTSRDSDGGKWRERTQNTSWYNEELNTATRGARREFPAVAVIVAESGNVKKLKIYDGDDPDLPLWMSFEASGLGSALGRSSNAIFGISSVCVLNGLLCVTGLGSGGNIETLCQISFIDDVFWQWHKYGFGDAGISERNEAHSVSTQEYRGRINEPINVGGYNDVAMTVLPNAPVDPATGLPTPTIAVACGDGSSSGFSIINHDGTVANKSYIESAKSQSVSFTSDNRLVVSQKRNSNGDIWVAIYDNLTTSTSTTGVIVHDPNISVKYNDINYLNLPNILSRTTGTIGDKYIMSENGLTLIDEGETYVDDDGAKIYGMAAYATSKYNTGWMPGDIKLAALSDSVVENVGVDESELVPNGTFDLNTNNWSSTNSTTLSVDNQRLKLQGMGSSYPTAYTSVNVVEGIEYEVSAEYISNSNSFSGRIRVSSSSPLGGDIVNGTIKSAGTTHVNRFTAPSTGSVYIALMLQDSGGNSSGIWDNVSVKRSGELITNGDFSNGTTGWSGLSGGVLSIDNERLKIEETTNAVDAYAVNSSVIPTVVGKKYIITWQFIKGTNTGFSVRFGNGGDQTSDYKSNTVGEYTDDGYYSFEFTATATELNLSFIVNEASTYGFVDNVSVRPVEADRSVNDNGLQIFGEINKTPVAPGADLVAYSGFSENNYLVQPYNADLDFTDTMSIMLWVKGVTGNFNPIDRGTRGVDHSYGLYLKDAGGDIRFYYSVDGTTDLRVEIADGASLIQSGWHHVAVCTSEGKIKMYVDGKLLKTADQVGNFYSQSINQNGLRVGRGSINSASWEDHLLAALRISATAPTAEQIAKIYRDEKPLFQQGAQATLYGTSDAVTALAYDQKTELLHVGTASGRSDFSGLSRVHQTNSPVTTCIDAEDGLIAEN